MLYRAMLRSSEAWIPWPVDSWDLVAAHICRVQSAPYGDPERWNTFKCVDVQVFDHISLRALGEFCEAQCASGRYFALLLCGCAPCDDIVRLA